jgi:hypothetical protein
MAALLDLLDDDRAFCFFRGHAQCLIERRVSASA